MPEPIARVYIACYKGDVRFTRLCVASLRKWHPDIPIVLLKDTSRGTFSTRDIEQATGATVFEGAGRKFGWGFSKLEPLFLETDERFLMLDSDIVVCGPIVDRLQALSGDFVVTGRPAETMQEKEICALYCNTPRIRSFDPTFEPPDYLFNTGQWVGRSGLLQRSDFDAVITWEPIPKPRYPDFFCTADQSVLNYALWKWHREGKIQMKSEAFGIWPAAKTALQMEFDEFVSPNLPAFVLHWAGVRKPLFRDMPRTDILRHYEATYFRDVAPQACRNVLVPQAIWWDYSLRWSVRAKMKVAQIIRRSR